MKSHIKRKSWCSKTLESFSNKEDASYISWNSSPEIDRGESGSNKKTGSRAVKPWINTEHICIHEPPEAAEHRFSTDSLKGKRFKSRSRKILEGCGLNQAKFIRSVSLPPIRRHSSKKGLPVLPISKRSKSGSSLSRSPVIGLALSPVIKNTSREPSSPILCRKKLSMAIDNICQQNKGKFMLHLYQYDYLI